MFDLTFAEKYGARLASFLKNSTNDTQNQESFDAETTERLRLAMCF